MPDSVFAVVDHYLGRLSEGPAPNAALRRAADGSVQGRFFACTLASQFQAIHALGAGASAQPVAFEGVARGVALADKGCSVWRMLDGAASDDESIALDRLCRVVHAINYFRQPPGAQSADLHLSVHDRLLAAVSSNHGDAFLRILRLLELPGEQIVLRLPALNPRRRWLANFVADNYRRNGFRLAFTAARLTEAIEIVNQFQPHAITIDARAVRDADALARLLTLARANDVHVIVTRLDTAAALAVLEQASRVARATVHAQGDFLDAPRAPVPAYRARVMAVPG